MPSFATLQGAVEHERRKTTERRATWSNLRAQISSTRSAVGFEAAATRELVSEEHARTRDEVRSGTGALAEHLQAGVDRILECQQRSGESSGSSQLVFFSRLLSELRVTELRQLLARRGIAVPAGGTKSMLARLAAEQLREEDLEEFLGRCNKRQRITPMERGGSSLEQGQGTLDQLFERHSATLCPATGMHQGESR